MLRLLMEAVCVSAVVDHGVSILMYSYLPQPLYGWTLKHSNRYDVYVRDKMENIGCGCTRRCKWGWTFEG
jgi:hypothetical protein